MTSTLLRNQRMVAPWHLGVYYRYTESPLYLDRQGIEMSNDPSIVPSSFGTTGTAVIAVADDGDGRRWVIVGLLSLGMVIAYLSRSNLAVALIMPDFIKAFQLSDTDR